VYGDGLERRHVGALERQGHEAGIVEEERRVGQQITGPKRLDTFFWDRYTSHVT
jgi:hypothetical protein